MAWPRLRGLSLGRGGRFDRKVAGLLVIMAVGCVNLALEGRRTRLIWSDLLGRERTTRAAPPAVSRPEGRPAATAVGRMVTPQEADQRRTTESPPTGPLDLNRATARELEALPGLGPALARRILAYRESHGPFRAVRELEQVSGIGPGRLAKLGGLLCVKEPPGDPR